MTYIEPYWLDDAAAPYTTLLRIVDAHCHPEAGPDAYDELIELAQVQEMRTFKNELRQLLSGDIAALPRGALWTAAEYGDGSDLAFLQRLWRDLYVDEPVDEQEARVERANKREIEAYWRDNPHGRFVTLLDVLDRYRDQYGELVRIVRSSQPPPWTLLMRTDLQQALRDASQVPNGALWTAARYDGENDEAFLHRLWHDLYGDEPVEDDGSRYALIDFVDWDERARDPAVR